MSEGQPDWDAWYSPLLGSKLEDIAFMPIRSDTSGIVAALDGPLLDFSGAVHLMFEAERSVFLTWMQVGDDYGLNIGKDISDLFIPRSLDTVHRGGARLWWDCFENAPLEAVGLYASQSANDPNLIVAAEHKFLTADSETTLWVSTGYAGKAEAGDDLVVSLNARPPADWPLTLCRTVQ